MFRFRRENRVVDIGHMAPPELYRDKSLWRRVCGLRPYVLPWQVRPYRREILLPGVNLYTAGLSARTLIVGLCGRDQRLFLPVGIILQNLDHRRFDLVTLWDRRELHFDHGIEGYARSLPELAARLSDFAASRGYGGIVTYGASMGAIPAMRIGELMKADRAVAAGGRFAWHIGRLLRNQASIQPFDPLCHCREPGPTEHYVIFSEDNAEDVQNAERLAAMRPDCRLIPMPHREHNFPYAVQKCRRLDEYQREIFDLRRRPDPAVLRRSLMKRSRLDPRRNIFIRL